MTDTRSPGDTLDVRPQGRDYDVDAVVRERYGAGAKAREDALCCPVEYEDEYLAILPKEILERDYGCGDPSKYCAAGETVIDLGSGAGKICYILSQKVGAKGRVIGIDMNDDMLELAEKYREELAQSIGWSNVEFRKGKIQDLATDLRFAEGRLAEKPVVDGASWAEFEAALGAQRKTSPLVADSSVDVIVSNCVLNLVETAKKRDLFAEMYRVLVPGGRCVISDIVCDEPPTERIMSDPDLWSGCISGAFLEEEFLQRFVDAGFSGVEILERQVEPWHVLDGIEFRSMTVRAWKSPRREGLDRGQAVVYRGPWTRVEDEAGRHFVRGQRTAVGDVTFADLTAEHGPFAGRFVGIEPYEAVEDPQLFRRASEPGSTGSTVPAIRSPRDTKGAEYRRSDDAPSDCCAPTDAPT